MTSETAIHYLEGLRASALHAINCMAAGSAYTLLDLGLAYGFPGGFPEEGGDLITAKIKIQFALMSLDPESGLDPSYWGDCMDKAVELLSRPITLQV